MKFACPESQKRVLLKCGNIASVPASSGGGSGGSVGSTPAGDAEARLCAWTAAGGVASGCCAKPGLMRLMLVAIENRNLSQRTRRAANWCCSGMFQLFSQSRKGSFCIAPRGPLIEVYQPQLTIVNHRHHASRMRSRSYARRVKGTLQSPLSPASDA